MPDTWTERLTMPDTYLYCADHGHILNEYTTTPDGLQQCECCAGYFDPEEN